MMGLSRKDGVVVLIKGGLGHREGMMEIYIYSHVSFREPFQSRLRPRGDNWYVIPVAE